jgi:hypothetical protein
MCTVIDKKFADKNICGNNICGQKMTLFLVPLWALCPFGPCAEWQFLYRENIYRKYFYPQKFSALRYFNFLIWLKFLICGYQIFDLFRENKILQLFAKTR